MILKLTAHFLATDQYSAQNLRSLTLRPAGNFKAVTHKGKLIDLKTVRVAEQQASYRGQSVRLYSTAVLLWCRHKPSRSFRFSRQGSEAE